MQTIYARVLVRAGESPDGETPTRLSVKRGEEFSLLVIEGHDLGEVILGAARPYADGLLVEHAVNFEYSTWVATLDAGYNVIPFFPPPGVRVSTFNPH
jgi:hypothetical protein